MACRQPFPTSQKPLPISPKSFVFTMLLGLLAALPVLSIDISAPTLVLLPKVLGTSSLLAGLTLSLFMAGFAGGQIAGGSLSDRRGRRPVLLAGLGCFTLAGFACALSRSGGALAAFRLIQGCGAGACSVVSFAMIQDLFEGEAARTKRSYVAVVFGAVPIIAPSLGAVLSDRAGWRSVHSVLAVAGGVLWLVTWRWVAESRAAGLMSPPPRGDRHARLRDDPRFVGLAVANALSYGAVFAYVAGSPFVIIGQLGRSSSVYAVVFSVTTAAFTAGAWVSGLLSRQGFGSARLVLPSLAVSAAMTLALAVVCLSGITGWMVLIPLLLVLLFSRGIIAPNMQHLAIGRQPERAGAASAAVGVTQLLSGALASACVAGLLPYLGPSGVAVPMALLATAALLAWRWAAP
jgi:DHA1 family bicyclomycin/chloramphenicol resistance-like MFS transporter